MFMKVLPQTFGRDELEFNKTNLNPKPPSILKRIASGDKSAVSDCVEIYGSQIWTAAKKFTDSTAEAEIIVLKIFNDIWKYASNYDAAKSSEAGFVGLIIYRRLVCPRTLAITGEDKN